MKLIPITVLAVSLVSLYAEQFPKIEGENLLGKQVVLPDAAAGQPAAIVIGFTQNSLSQTKAWTSSVQQELPIFTVAVLEDTPRLVRGTVMRGMKKGIPEDQRDHFIVIDHNGRDLKQAAGFDRPDDAYVLLLDKNGAIHWRFRGAVTDAALQELESQASELSH